MQNKPSYEELVSTLLEIVQGLPINYAEVFEAEYSNRQSDFSAWRTVLCRASHGVEVPCNCQKLFSFRIVLAGPGDVFQCDDVMTEWHTAAEAEDRAAEILAENMDCDFIEVHEGAQAHGAGPRTRQAALLGVMTKQGWRATWEEALAA